MRDRALDPEQMQRRRVTSALHTSRWPRWGWLLGHPLRIEVEQAISRDVPTSEYDDLVANIERFMRLEGRTAEVPGAYHWTCGGRLGGIRVAFIPWRGGMGIRVIGRYWDRLLVMLLIAAAVGWMPGLVVVAGMELGPSSGTIAIAVGYLVTYLATCVLWHARGREQEHGLVELVERLVVHLAAQDPELRDPERRAERAAAAVPLAPGVQASGETPGAHAVADHRATALDDGTSESR